MLELLTNVLRHVFVYPFQILLFFGSFLPRSSVLFTLLKTWTLEEMPVHMHACGIVKLPQRQLHNTFF